MFSNTQGDCSYCIRPYCYSDYVPYDESSAMNYDPSNPYELTELKCSHIFHSRCLVNYGKESCPKCDGCQFSDYSQKKTPTILLEYIRENFDVDDEEESSEDLSSPPLPLQNHLHAAHDELNLTSLSSNEDMRTRTPSPSPTLQAQQNSDNEIIDDEESFSCELSNYETIRNSLINREENQVTLLEELLIRFRGKELDEMHEEANGYTDVIGTKMQTALDEAVKMNTEYRVLLDKIRDKYEKLELSLQEKSQELNSILENSMHFLKQLPEFHFEYNTYEVADELKELQLYFSLFLLQLETAYRLGRGGEISNNVRSSLESLRELAKNIRFGWGK